MKADSSATRSGPGRHLLLTGASGFLGGYLAGAAIEAGWSIVATGRSRPAEEAGDFVECDLAAGEPVLGSTCFKRVVHAAGLAHTLPRTASDAARFFQVNVSGTVNLLAAVDRTGTRPESLCLISSVAVYGRDEGELLPEETPRLAEDPYGRSRSQAEEKVLAWGAARGVAITILRLPLVAGRNAPGNLGAMVRGLRTGRYLGLGSGRARRSVVLAEDVARLAAGPGLRPGIFNLTDGAHPTFAEIENAICRAIGRNPPPRMPLPIARAAGRLGDGVSRLTGRRPPITSNIVTKMTTTLTFDDAAARRELDWSPRRVLDHAAELVA